MIKETIYVCILSKVKSTKVKQHNSAIFQSINFIVSLTHNNAHNTSIGIHIPRKRSFHKIGNIYALVLQSQTVTKNYFDLNRQDVVVFVGQIFQVIFLSFRYFSYIGPNLPLLCWKDSPTLIHKLNLTWNWVSAIFSMKSPFSNLKFEARGNANVWSNPTQMQENKKFCECSNYFKWKS